MPATVEQQLSYMSGFGNEFQSEALPGSLPRGRNNPRICPYGLYAEQLSGTAFTTPRKHNQRTWLYRILPSVVHKPFQPWPNKLNITSDPAECIVTPKQLRWKATPLPTATTDFVHGLVTMCCAGSPSMKDGYAIHIYAINSNMDNCCMCNADGDFLIVPQHGALLITTEMGRMQVSPGEIAVVQRGIRFAIDLADGAAATEKHAGLEQRGARGYVLEVFGAHFQLPDLGPIGANGLANARDFQIPEAWYENRKCTFKVIQKVSGHMFICEQEHSAFNVVAWHGNYVPYKYDLSRFCPAGFVGFDHADPSIFTVLTCPSAVPGVALADFVVFPARWVVAENTFRPPYFHRNTMSEYMGLVRGTYDGKNDGFEPGGSSLHTCMAPHGPDQETFEEAVDEAKASQPETLPPTTLAFMFEVNAIPHVTEAAMALPWRDQEYNACWQDLKSHFTASPGM